MKVVELTTWERVTLLGCIPPTCPLVELPKYLRIVEILTLTEGEEKIVGFLRLPDGRSAWTKTKYLFSIDFENADYRFLMQLVRARKQWPTLKETQQVHDKLEDVAAQPAKEREEPNEEAG